MQISARKGRVMMPADIFPVSGICQIVNIETHGLHHSGKDDRFQIPNPDLRDSWGHG
jgi:hypothetical protein